MQWNRLQIFWIGCCRENKKKFKKKDLQIRTYVCIMIAYRDRSGVRTGLKVNFYAIMPHDTNLYYRKII